VIPVQTIWVNRFLDEYGDYMHKREIIEIRKIAESALSDLDDV